MKKLILILMFLWTATVVHSQITVTLNGSGSTDSSGTITSYKWNQVSGTPVTINNSNSVIATVVINVAGVYVFSLKVCDAVTNLCSVNADSTTTITVNAAFKRPHANAGLNQTFTLPTAMIEVKKAEYLVWQKPF